MHTSTSSFFFATPAPPAEYEVAMTDVERRTWVGQLQAVDELSAFHPERTKERCSELAALKQPWAVPEPGKVL